MNTWDIKINALNNPIKKPETLFNPCHNAKVLEYQDQIRNLSLSYFAAMFVFYTLISSFVHIVHHMTGEYAVRTEMPTI